MVTEVFLGDLGTGKTTMLTRKIILTKKLNPEKKIFCNFHLKNYVYEPLDLMDLYLNHRDEKNIIIGADELYTMMDCRIASSFRNRIESYFIAMTRKKDCDFFATMQYERFIDLRFSVFVKVKYIMESIMVKHEVFIDGMKYVYRKPHPFLFICNILDERSNTHPVVKRVLFNGSKWFKEFDTSQVIYPPDDVLMNVEINSMKKRVQYEKLKNQIKKLDDGVNIFDVNKKKKSL